MMKHRTFASFLQSNTTNIFEVYERSRMNDDYIKDIYSGRSLPSFRDIFELARAIEESPLAIIKAIQLDVGDYFDLRDEVSTLNMLGYQVSHDEKTDSFDFVRIL